MKSGIGRYRWRICALLFLATTINYMDRSVLSVLAPTLQYKVFNWSNNDFAWINISFKTAYAIGLLCMGAYSHSRLRQLILGGVTRHVLEHADLPVMMNR